MPEKAKFELLFFEELLRTQLSPINIKETLKTTSSTQYSERLSNESLRIKNELLHLACSNCSETHLERYIRMHERGAIRILDQVYAIIRPDGDAVYSDIKASRDCMEVYLAIKAALKGLLNFIETELTRYFDLDQQVSVSFRDAAAQEIDLGSSKLYSELKKKEISLALQEGLLSYFRSQCASPSCTYKQLKFAKLALANLLKALLEKESRDSREWELRVLTELIHLNFNKSSLFGWCRAYIATEIDGYQSTKEQTERFNWYAKEIIPMDTIPDVFYKSGRTSMKELLREYISAELAYLAEWHKEHPGIAATNLKERAQQFDVKLKLGMTVAQLGLLVQLLMQVGLLLTEKGKIKDMLTKVADNVSTIGAEQVSQKSLDNHRKPKPKTVAWMEEILGRLTIALQEIANS